MQNMRRLAGVLAACWLLAAGCSRKAPVDRVIVVDGDTTAVSHLLEIMPDSSLSPAQIRGLGVAMALSRDLPTQDDTTDSRAVADDLAAQLSRETGVEWSPEGARLLHRGAKALYAHGKSGRWWDSLTAHVNSAVARVILPDTSLPLLTCDTPDSAAGGNRAVTPEQFSALLACALCLEHEIAGIVSDFVSSEDFMSDTGDPADLVKGLVLDSAELARRRPRHETRRRRTNALLALQYRTRTSIKDTISRHIPNLEAIYRQQLRKHPGMEGTIVVAFRITHSGSVVSATMRKSDIQEPDFTVPFVDYVKKIKFKSIPPKVGDMAFDFPFEFRPES